MIYLHGLDLNVCIPVTQIVEIDVTDSTSIIDVTIEASTDEIDITISDCGS